MLSRIMQRHTLFVEKNKYIKYLLFFCLLDASKPSSWSHFLFLSFFFLFPLRSCEGQHTSPQNGRGHHIHFTHPVFILGPSVVPCDRVIALCVPTRDSCGCPCEQRFSPRLSNKHITIFFWHHGSGKKDLCNFCLKIWASCWLFYWCLHTSELSRISGFCY